MPASRPDKSTGLLGEVDSLRFARSDIALSGRVNDIARRRSGRRVLAILLAAASLNEALNPPPAATASARHIPSLP
jgi:hypothetical protein